MSIFRNISRILGGGVGRSILDKLGRKTSDGHMSASDLQASQDREAARRAQRAEEIKSFIASKQSEVSPGVSSVSGSLPSKSYDRRLAGYTKPENNRFETIDSSYTPYALRPKQFRALPNQMFTRGTMFADGTPSAKAHLANQGVRRFNNEEFVGDQSYDLRDFDETNVPPPPSSLVQPFAQPVKQSANQIFGDLFARQNAVGAPMMFKINK